MTHTPGPWAIQYSTNDYEGNLIYADRLLHQGRSPIAATVTEEAGEVTPEDIANARLIAAAPEAPHDCEVPDCPGARNKRLLDATEGLLEACRLALTAQQLRTRKILHQIASEYSNEPPPTPEHTLPEEEEAHNKLTAAIAKAEEED